MISRLRYLAHLWEPNRADFALWTAEMQARDVRLTSEPWVGWLEDLDGFANFG